MFKNVSRGSMEVSKKFYRSSKNIISGFKDFSYFQEIYKVQTSFEGTSMMLMVFQGLMRDFSGDLRITQEVFRNLSRRSRGLRSLKGLREFQRCFRWFQGHYKGSQGSFFGFSGVLNPLRVISGTSEELQRVSRGFRGVSMVFQGRIMESQGCLADLLRLTGVTWRLKTGEFRKVLGFQEVCKGFR